MTYALSCWDAAFDLLKISSKSKSGDASNKLFEKSLISLLKQAIILNNKDFADQVFEEFGKLFLAEFMLPNAFNTLALARIEAQEQLLLHLCFEFLTVCSF